MSNWPTPQPEIGRSIGQDLPVGGYPQQWNNPNGFPQQGVNHDEKQGHSPMYTYPPLIEGQGLVRGQSHALIQQVVLQPIQVFNAGMNDYQRAKQSLASRQKCFIICNLVVFALLLIMIVFQSFTIVNLEEKKNQQKYQSDDPVRKKEAQYLYSRAIIGSTLILTELFVELLPTLLAWWVVNSISYKILIIAYSLTNFLAEILLVAGCAIILYSFSLYQTPSQQRNIILILIIGTFVHAVLVIFALKIRKQRGELEGLRENADQLHQEQINGLNYQMNNFAYQ